VSDKPKTPPPSAPALPSENFRPISQCRTLEQLFSSSDFRERIVASVPRHMTADRMLSVALRAHSRDPLLSQATPQSFAGACLTATNIGLEPNSALNEAYLIPFKRTIRERGKEDRVIVEIQVIFGYSGLLKLVDNTGRVLTHSANVVYSDSDIFDWEEGTNTFLRFKRGGRRPRTDQDKATYAYFHATIVGGGQSIEVWPYGEVMKIRNGSQAFRRAVAARDEAAAAGRREPLAYRAAPWVAFEEPMARKTMIRAGTKYLPKSAELATAIHLDELTDKRSIDYSRVIDMAGNPDEPNYSQSAIILGDQSEDEEWAPREDDRQPQQADAPRGDAPQGDQRTPATGRAGHVDTRPTVVPIRTAQPAEPRTATPPASPSSPSFEHYLIDDTGDYDADAAPYVDPVVFANAFVEMFRRAADRTTLCENNEQALEEARGFPIADQILSVIDAATEVPLTHAPIPVLHKRDGRPDWVGFTATFRSAVSGSRGELSDWLDMQRPALEQAPPAQRLLLIKAVRERAAQLRQPIPGWITELATARPPPQAVRGPAAPAQDAPQASPQDAPQGAAAQPAADAPPAKGAPLTDAQTVAAIIRNLDMLSTLAEFAEYATSTAVKTQMLRLKREAPAEFERADNAFAHRRTQIAGPPPRDGEQG
jgi:recombination protein RecT